MTKKVNLCEIGPTTFNGVKFEAEKVISPNSQEHLKGKGSALSMNNPLLHLLIYKVHFLTDFVKFRKLSALCEI